VKKKEFNIKLNGLTIEELRELLANTQTNLSKLKMNHRTAELENPLEIRSVRRNSQELILKLKKENYNKSVIN
jgi:ribosomal protein L29